MLRLIYLIFALTYPKTQLIKRRQHFDFSITKLDIESVGFLKLPYSIQAI